MRTRRADLYRRRETDESYHDFAQALVDMVENAISLVGSKYAFGWWIYQEGVKTSFAEGWHQFKREIYVGWRIGF